MTKLTKPVHRITDRKYGKRNIVVTVAPAGAQNEALIAFRLLGTRCQYVCAVSSLFTLAAMWHGQKEAKAKREARKNGVPWRLAKKQFDASNRI